MSENAAYEKFRSLEAKGCIAILDSTREGRKIRLSLPSEIAGVVVPEAPVEALDLEAQDFFGRAYGLRDEEYLRLKVLTCMLPPL